MPHLQDTRCCLCVCVAFSVLVCVLVYWRALSEVKVCCSNHGGREERHHHHNAVLNGSQCSSVVSELHFISAALSPEEESYPLAFILTVHKELDLFFRVFRAIYAPQNVYCVHVDSKAPRDYLEAVGGLLRCFDNAFLSSRSEAVTYAGFSRLQADLHCMRDLLRPPLRWRKVVNLCGQDFPVQTNLELVQYLQSPRWRDRNMTPGVPQPPAMAYRTQLQYEVTGSRVALKGAGLRKAPPPHNLQLYFGTAYYALTRAFVAFVLESRTARDLLEWSRDTFSPDEHYWVTLNHLREAPGSHADGGWEGNIRAIKWRDQEGSAHDGCKGRYVRDICVYGVDDLPWVIGRNSMFANKLEGGPPPAAVDRLERWHRDKVLEQARVPIQTAWRLATPTTPQSSFLTLLQPSPNS